MLKVGMIALGQIYSNICAIVLRRVRTCTHTQVSQQRINYSQCWHVSVLRTETVRPKYYPSGRNSFLPQLLPSQNMKTCLVNIDIPVSQSHVCPPKWATSTADHLAPRGLFSTVKIPFDPNFNVSFSQHC